MAEGLLSRALEYNATRALLLYRAKQAPAQQRIEYDSLLSGTILYHKKPEDKQPSSSPTMAEGKQQQLKVQPLQSNMQQQQLKVQSLDPNLQQQQLEMQSSLPYIGLEGRQPRKIRQNPTTLSRNKSNPQKGETP